MECGVRGSSMRCARNCRPQAALFIVLCILTAGCTGASSPSVLRTNRAVPSASPAPGSTRVRAADGMQMLYVPAGRFKMGSDYVGTAFARRLCRQYTHRDSMAACQQSNYRDESPSHAVTLGAYWIDRTEVTNGQYQQCEFSGTCEPPAERGSHHRLSYYGDPQYANYPVIFVTRGQAISYCAWVGARLPTEAEWEYAARGPDSRTFPWGDAFDGTRLNYCDARCDQGPSDPAVNDGYADTAPVGSFPSGASWIGALDMAGNVREWVADWYGSYTPDAQTNPRGPDSGELVVPRGGSWIDNPSIVRSANRGGNTPDYYRNYYGFRCAAAD